MADQTATARPEWHEDPNVISWDWREQPDLVELHQLLGRHGLTVEQVDTGTDDYAIRITAAPPVEPGPVHYRTHLGILAADADHRREWAAAYRHAADAMAEPGADFYDEMAAWWLRRFADRIERGSPTDADQLRGLLADRDRLAETCQGAAWLIGEAHKETDAARAEAERARPVVQAVRGWFASIEFTETAPEADLALALINHDRAAGVDQHQQQEGTDG